MPNLAKRLLSAAVMVPAVVCLLLFGPAWSIALVLAVIALLAGLELAAMSGPKSPFAVRLPCAFLALATSSAVSLSFLFPMGSLIIMLAIAPLSLLPALFSSSEPSVSAPRASLASFGAVYCGALLGSISLLYPITSIAQLSSSASPPPEEGRTWILLLFSGIVASDTFAYACGRLLGKRKLAPRISPGKTWAGAVGALFGSAAAVAIFKLTALPELRWWEVAALGVPLSIAGQLGDLAESLLKRGCGVKDSGRLIPGHGGVLDRVDAIMFGAPLVLLYTMVR
jgi:phosphatidate cytidylyltransferase